jgi:ribonuclease E
MAELPPVVDAPPLVTELPPVVDAPPLMAELPPVVEALPPIVAWPPPLAPALVEPPLALPEFVLLQPLAASTSTPAESNARAVNVG